MTVPTSKHYLILDENTEL